MFCGPSNIEATAPGNRRFEFRVEGGSNEAFRPKAKHGRGELLKLW
jgi:hypothetical protein